MLKESGIQVEKNAHFSSLFLDCLIEINGIKIDIEYDGQYWHQDTQKDIRRDKFIQSNGYKVIRIKSNHKVPTIEELYEKINLLINSDRYYEEIILDDYKKYKQE